MRKTQNEQAKALLASKGLTSDLLIPANISFASDISNHVSKAWHDIYQHPYKGSANAASVARIFHGISHAARVTYYVPVIANLYCQFQEGQYIHQDDVKLLQVAALFHDAARENDDKDHWDNQSAELLYHYLIITLGVPHEKAVIFAECIANKDYFPGQIYQQLIHYINGSLCWKKETASHREKTLFQKILHDADCLDIIRARDQFQMEYLDFFQDIAIKNQLALFATQQLIAEARSLIEYQGDTRNNLIAGKKIAFNSVDCFERTVALIHAEQNFKLLGTLYHVGPLLFTAQFNVAPLLAHPRFNEQADTPDYLSERNVIAAMREYKLFYRGVGAPSALGKNNEIFGKIEVRKILRRPNIKTRTEKPDKCGKDGNPERSISLLYAGGSVYSNVGFGLLNPDLATFSAIGECDLDSGRGKKKLKLARSDDQITIDFQQLKENILFGKQKGYTPRFARELTYYHTEIIARLREVQLIIFTTDPTVFNHILYFGGRDNIRPYHPVTPILEALYLQHLYQEAVAELPAHAAYAGIQTELLLFQYSGLHGTLREFKSPTEEQIFSYWKTLSDEYFSKFLTDYAMLSELTQGIDTLKTQMCYGQNWLRFSKAEHEITPLDKGYSETLSRNIDAYIATKHEHTCDEIKNLFQSQLERGIGEIHLTLLGFFLAHYRSFIEEHSILFREKCFEFISHIDFTKEWKNKKSLHLIPFIKILLMLFQSTLSNSDELKDEICKKIAEFIVFLPKDENSVSVNDLLEIADQFNVQPESFGSDFLITCLHILRMYAKAMNVTYNVKGIIQIKDLIVYLYKDPNAVCMFTAEVDAVIAKIEKDCFLEMNLFHADKLSQHKIFSLYCELLKIVQPNEMPITIARIIAQQLCCLKKHANYLHESSSYYSAMLLRYRLEIIATTPGVIVDLLKELQTMCEHVDFAYQLLKETNAINSARTIDISLRHAFINSVWINYFQTHFVHFIDTKKLRHSYLLMAENNIIKNPRAFLSQLDSNQSDLFEKQRIIFSSYCTTDLFLQLAYHHWPTLSSKEIPRWIGVYFYHSFRAILQKKLILLAENGVDFYSEFTSNVREVISVSSVLLLMSALTLSADQYDQLILLFGQLEENDKKYHPWKVALQTQLSQRFPTHQMIAVERVSKTSDNSHPDSDDAAIIACVKQRPALLDALCKVLAEKNEYGVSGLRVLFNYSPQLVSEIIDLTRQSEALCTLFCTALEETYPEPYSFGKTETSQKHTGLFHLIQFDIDVSDFIPTMIAYATTHKDFCCHFGEALWQNTQKPSYLYRLLCLMNVELSVSILNQLIALAKNDSDFKGRFAKALNQSITDEDSDSDTVSPVYYDFSDDDAAFESSSCRDAGQKTALELIKIQYPEHYLMIINHALVEEKMDIKTSALSSGFFTQQLPQPTSERFNEKVVSAGSFT